MICALLPGVQTCALPIFENDRAIDKVPRRRDLGRSSLCQPVAEAGDLRALQPRDGVNEPESAAVARDEVVRGNEATGGNLVAEQDRRSDRDAVPGDRGDRKSTSLNTSH